MCGRYSAFREEAHIVAEEELDWKNNLKLCLPGTGCLTLNSNQGFTPRLRPMALKASRIPGPALLESKTGLRSRENKRIEGASKRLISDRLL
jgi:hypothetical protein